jgi:predicted RNA binding protein YcfA (HicA-like mRNA interferase family)
MLNWLLPMSAKANELSKVARKLGFEKVRQKGSHARWKHSDGRSTTIPIHGNAEIGSWLFYEILKQMGITEEEFEQLR